MKAPNIIVCLKTVPDPEGPSTAFQVDRENKKVVTPGISPVISPFDENALEVALQLKAAHKGRVVALNISERPVIPVLRKALMVGADDLIVIGNPGFKGLTALSTATVLSAAIQKIGSFDLILTGRQAADWDSGQVGLMLAERLKIPAVNLAQSVELEADHMLVEKIKRRGYEKVRSPLPALVTVSSEAGELRRPTLRAIQKTKKKPVTTWDLDDLGIDPSQLKKKRIRELQPPPARNRTCHFLEGASEEEKGRNLVVRLRQDQIIQ